MEIEAQSPFLDESVRAPLQPLQKLGLAARAPLGLWRSTMLATVTISYLIGANLLLLFEQDQGKRYKLLKPFTQAYLCRFSLWCIGCRVKLHGEENLRGATTYPSSFVVVPNHVSMLDFWALGAAFGPCCVVAKDAVRKVPLLGPLAEGLGAVFVDRNAGKAGKAEVIARRARVLGAGSTTAPLLVFPEGTCTTGRCVINFRRGAFIPGAPVLPVALQYETASGMSAGWVGPLSTYQQIFRVLCQWWVNVDVKVLPLHYPTEQELKDPTVFASTIQEQIAAAMHVPTRNDYTIEQSLQVWADLGNGAMKN